jgi:glycosyltransferase involved in cell wall biosynthesis
LRTISVVIITLNESRNLGRCLQSVQRIADEIVVLDSYSTDDTGAIAKRFGARVQQQPFAGYAQQKRDADALAGSEWILSIDADEALSPELEASLLDFKSSTTPPANSAYRLSRLTNYCGTWIRHCGWYPDRKVRLYKKGAGNWVGENLHEAWALTGENMPYGLLSGDLLHYSYYTLSEHILQFNKFTEIAARTAVAGGKDCSVLKVWGAPKWRFFQMYILKRGFLDGYAGYLVCKFSAVAAQLKYAKIRQYRRQEDVPQQL